MKEYQIKVYDMLWVYKSTINPLLIKTAISFSMNINWWQGEIKIWVNKKITDTDYKFSDMIIITIFDKNNNGKQIYRWHITRIKRIIDNKWEGIELTCLWSIAFMNRIFFRSSWWNLTFSQNILPSQTMKDVIDRFNTNYNYFTYAKIINYVNNINISFDYSKSWEALNIISKSTPLRYYYVDSIWDVTYRAKNDVLVNHRVKIDNEVDYFVSNEEIETLSNKIYINKTWSPFIDTASISEYWRIEANINWQGDGNDYLQAKKDYKKEIKLIINSKYNIESIEPWHHITLLNADYTIQPLQVMRVDYSYNQVKLDLEKYSTLAETILS